MSIGIYRIAKTTGVTLTHEVRVDEVLTDAVDPLAVAVERLDGTDVAAGTSTRASLGTYTYALAAQPNLDRLLVRWTGVVAGATVTFTDVVEIVGGFYFDLSVARSRYRELRDPAVVTPARMAAIRTEIEVEFDMICGQAFVPRFERVEVYGRGTPYLAVPDRLVRTVRAITVDGVVWTAGQLATVRPSAAGYLVRKLGAIWPLDALVAAEYEHGMLFCPPSISTAGILRVRSLVNPGASGVPDRTETIITSEGSSYRLAMPGRDSTGIPDVDGALAKYPRHQRTVFA